MTVRRIIGYVLYGFIVVILIAAGFAGTSFGTGPLAGGPDLPTPKQLSEMPMKRAVLWIVGMAVVIGFFAAVLIYAFWRR